MADQPVSARIKDFHELGVKNRSERLLCVSDDGNAAEQPKKEHAGMSAAIIQTGVQQARRKVSAGAHTGKPCSTPPHQLSCTACRGIHNAPASRHLKKRQ
ncbi:hypothetical protein LJR098_004101 [Rhizobium sp. LjRoot98]|uniref:hypothetical protein n=1 Tax=unclassified Rhizobium TaxID=2613769 RepID=UPI000AD50DAC|nr:MULTISPECIES: hypothetical protein [unclassified Rhizobium]